MARKNRHRLRPYRYELHITRYGSEHITFDPPAQPWLSVTGDPVWIIELRDERTAFAALAASHEMSKRLAKLTFTLLEEQIANGHYGNPPVTNAATLAMSLPARVWTLYRVTQTADGETALRRIRDLDLSKTGAFYEEQLRRWGVHHLNESTEKHMQRVLFGRIAGYGRHDIEYETLYRAARRKCHAQDAELRALRVAHERLQQSYRKLRVKYDEALQYVEKTAAGSSQYIVSAEERILKAMQEKAPGVTDKPLFAMGWDYTAAPISIDMLMNTVTAFGTDGVTAVDAFRKLYAKRTEAAQFGRTNGTNLVLYAFHPHNRPHGVMRTLFVYQHDAAELNHISTLS